MRSNSRLNHPESGQAIVEYLLTLLMVISIMGIIYSSFRKGSGSLWKKITIQVAAPCPGCPPPSDTLSKVNKQKF